MFKLQHSIFIKKTTKQTSRINNKGDYFFNRYTLTELSKKSGYLRGWIQDKIYNFIPKINTPNPREVIVVIYATFFGKREDKFGLIATKYIELKMPIAYNFIESESKETYESLTEQIRVKGFTIKAVVLDEKPGIFSLFDGIYIPNVPLSYESYHHTKTNKKS